MTVKLTLDGAPLEGAIVSLVQLTGEGRTAVGVTDSSGVAVVKSTEGWEGVFPGDYSVMIKKTEYSTSSTPEGNVEVDRTSPSEENVYSVSRELLPQVYGNPATSGFQVTQENKAGSCEFSLSSNP